MNSESEEQQSLFRWLALATCRIPGLAMAFAIPNGGLRTKATAARLKAEGVKAGVPDLFLPIARDEFHGLFIEMKSLKGRLSDEQEEWIFSLQAKRYAVAICYGWQHAAATILDYLGEPAEMLDTLELLSSPANRAE